MLSINSKSAILHCWIHLIRETKAYDTWDSQAVSDPSTNQAQRCLTCQIGRDGVFSTWYGRKRSYRSDFNVMKSEKGVMEEWKGECGKGKVERGNGGGKWLVMEGTENCGKGEIHAVLVANGTIDVSFL